MKRHKRAGLYTPNNFVTPAGKKIIAIHVYPEFEEKILAAAKKKNLTRQSFIITAILAAFEKENLSDAERGSRDEENL